MVLQLIKSPNGPNTSANERARAAETLREEIATLRGALFVSRKSLLAQGPGGEPAEISRLCTVIARLSDAIARAMLAEQKLRGSGDEVAELQAEVQRFFRAIGWGENT